MHGGARHPHSSEWHCLILEIMQRLSDHVPRLNAHSHNVSLPAFAVTCSRAVQGMHNTTFIFSLNGFV